MFNRPKLTPRQQQILELVRSTISQTGAPPTRAEIAHTMGFRSANAAEEHLRALARKGVLDLVSGTSRGIRINPAWQLVPEDNAHLSLPLIGHVAAGSPILAQEHIDRHFSVESSLFERKPDYLLRVRGMSMRDAGILDGDLLAVQATTEVRNGQIIVARLGDEVTVKRLQRHATHIALHPENPDFPVIDVKDHEQLAIEGLAVGLIRKGLAL